LPARSTSRSSFSARARSFWSSRPRRRPRGERATRGAQLSATSSSRGRQPMAAGFRRFMGGRMSDLPYSSGIIVKTLNYRGMNYPVCQLHRCGTSTDNATYWNAQWSCARRKDCSVPIGLNSPHPQSGRRTRSCGRQVRFMVALVPPIQLLCYPAAVPSIECELRDERLSMSLVPKCRSGVPESAARRAASHVRPMRRLYLDIRRIEETCRTNGRFASPATVPLLKQPS
jgi:hypothetical protein